MSEAKRKIAARLSLRRGLDEAESAVYVGLGPSKFRSLVHDGIMPRPHIVGSRRIWDIDDLDAAFKALPVEGETDTWADVA